MSPSRLSKWLERQWKKALSFQLAYLTGESSEELLGSWDKSDVDEIDNFAGELISSAQDKANGERLICRFAVRAFAVDGKKLAEQVIKQYPLDSDNPDLSRGPLPQEGNSALQQMVRMNEILLRQQNDSMGRVFSTMKDMLQVLNVENRELRKREEKLQALIERIIVDRTEDGEDTSDGAQRSLALDRLVDVAEKVAPTLVESVARKIGTVGASEQTVTFGSAEK